MECHGCKGKGWVETAGGVMVHKCPICNGTGWVPTTTRTAGEWGVPKLGICNDGLNILWSDH